MTSACRAEHGRRADRCDASRRLRGLAADKPSASHRPWRLGVDVARHAHRHSGSARRHRRAGSLRDRDWAIEPGRRRRHYARRGLGRIGCRTHHHSQRSRASTTLAENRVRVPNASCKSATQSCGTSAYPRRPERMTAGLRELSARGFGGSGWQRDGFVDFGPVVDACSRAGKGGGERTTAAGRAPGGRKSFSPLFACLAGRRRCCENPGGLQVTPFRAWLSELSPSISLATGGLVCGGSRTVLCP